MMDGRKQGLFILLSLLLLNSQSDAVDASNMDDQRRHFILVHGASHGAWCWYKVATLLRSAGHRVTALDLAASGIDPKQVQDLRSVSDYYEPLLKLMEHSVPEEERVILVGHSLGGLSLAKAMESFPHKIAAAVFVTALMPGPALNASTVRQESTRRRGPEIDFQYIYGDGPQKPPTAYNFGPITMRILYHLSPPEDLTLGTMLVRPTSLFSSEDLSKEIVLSSKKYGTVSRVYVISEEDKVIKEDFQWWMIKKNPVDLVMKIEGSDHMVMFSKPLQLTACLQQIAKHYA